jgi:hypothetical protein
VEEIGVATKMLEAEEDALSVEPPPMEEELPSDEPPPAPTSKKSKFGLDFNRVVVDGDMLILTDSTLMNSLFGKDVKLLAMSESNKAILSSQFGLNFNVQNLFNVSPQAKAMTMMMKDIPIKDLQMTFKGKSFNMSIASPKTNENFIMTFTKSIDKLVGFFLSMKNMAPVRPDGEPSKEQD